MDELLGDFIAESREMLEALESEIVAWEADPADRTRLDTIFRFFHTVKGNCGFFDFPRLETLSHAAEDALSEVRSGQREPTAAFVDAVLAVIDRIAGMIDAIDAGKDISGGDDTALIESLAHAGSAAEAGEDEAGLTQPGLAPRSAGALRSVRLPINLLDRVMSGVSDMVLARNELARRIADLGEGSGLEAPFNRLSNILTDVRDAITRTRMQRIETLFAGFPRLVRDLSAELGKQVMVEIQGGDVELDREMIEMIRDPLVHILRNAIDHGIETPAQRRAAGKREIGLLRMSARQTGNQIRIAISDDGRGLDTERLIAKALSAGVLTAEQAERITPEEARMLVFEPGLSTADAVSAVSGRGVGLDVVRANIERIGGTVAVHSVPGEDCRFLLSLPLTLSIVPSLTVSAGGQRFAIPRSYVDEIFLFDEGQGAFIRAGGRQFLEIRDSKIACAELAEVLDLPAPAERKARWVVLVRMMAGDVFGLIVDRVLDHHDLVAKPIAPVIMGCGLYVGSTQLDDGSPILMLDVVAIGQAAGLLGELEARGYRPVGPERRDEESPGLPVLLFVGLDGRRRAVAMGAVKRYEDVPVAAINASTGAPRVVIGEVILPLAGLSAALPAEGTVEVLRLTDGEHELVYAVAEVLDTTTIGRDLAPVDNCDEALGLALIGGEAVEVIDPLALFERHGLAEAAPRPPVCRIPSGDAWMQDFLRPLIEQAGYVVVDEHAQDPADVSVLLEGSAAAAAPLAAAATVVLRSTRTAASGADGTIYRYDRKAVLAALAAAAEGRAA
ncbi:MAG TPA: chemotaxis protein CheA [Novosphingobium sp.]|nr:chemotaxis protein CheA [Novosphingobium sp.]